MSPLAKPSRENQARDFDKVVKAIDLAFHVKQAIMKLSRAFNECLREEMSIKDQMEYTEDIQALRDRMSAYRQNRNKIVKLVFHDRSVNLEDYLIKDHLDFIVSEVESKLKERGLLIRKRFWDIKIPSRYMSKVTEMLDKLEKFAEGKESKGNEFNVHIAVITKLYDQDDSEIEW